MSTAPNVTIIPAKIQTAENRDKYHQLKVAAYCRVSTEQEEQQNSYQVQIAYYTDLINRKKEWTLAGIFADEGISGTQTKKRTEFNRMIRMCKNKKIDLVITKSISRFARNTKDCLKSVRELKALGITIFFEKENIDTANMTDEMMITIMGGLAQEESTSISQNMRWSIKKRMQNGTYRNSCPPFGYTVQNDTLVVNEEQAKIVKQIFNWYNEGYGLQAIADTLNSMAVPSSQTAERWHASSVKYVLSNERYIGDALFQKKYRTETLPTMQKRNRGEKPKYYVQSVNTPIIDKDIFYSVQELLNKRHREYINNNHFLSKRILCSKCGATYKCVSSKNSVFWTCRTHNNKASDCSNGRIADIKIYAAFVRLCNKLLYNYKTVLIPLQTALLFRSHLLSEYAGFEAQKIQRQNSGDGHSQRNRQAS